MSENSAHSFMFSLRLVLEECNKHLAESSQGKFTSHVEDSVLELVESASEGFIRWGAQIGSSFGAWISGIPDTAAPSGSAGGSVKEQHLSVPPALGEGQPPALLNHMLWLQVRFVLLTVYELLCGTGGDLWMRVCAEHDVPPWASDTGTRKQIPSPVACPPILLDIFTLTTFCLHANTKPAALSTHMSLYIIRCLAESSLACALLFAMGFEGPERVNELSVFERRGAQRDGLLAFVHASPPRVASKSTSSTPNELEERKQSLRVNLARASKGFVEKSLAAVLFRQVSCVLLEHATPHSSQSGAELESQHDITAEDAVALNGARSKRIHHHANANLRSRSGALCLFAIESLHRLILFQRREVKQEDVALLGIEWGLVSAGLFTLLEALSEGPQRFKDLSGTKFVHLCAQVFHVINLVLCSSQETSLERLLFIHEILSRRAAIERLGELLERDPDLSAQGGSRLAQHDMGNLSIILFHFAHALMKIEEIAGDEVATDTSTTASKLTKHALPSKEVQSMLAHGLTTLRLKPHDRLRDGYQRFTETSEVRIPLREFLTQLVSDAKYYKLLERSIKKQPSDSAIR